MRAPLVLLPLIALLPLTGCAVAAIGTVGAVGLTASKDQTFGQSVDDISGANQIRGWLITESASRFGDVSVEVAGGLALLSGRVYNAEDRAIAEGLAWRSVFVTDVANELKIEQPGGFVANMSDQLISSRVRTRLIGSSSVKSINYNIETYNGVVYLMGVARTTEELRKAAEEASLVGGVKQVVSYVRVVDEVQRPSAPITQMPSPAPAQAPAMPSYQPQPNNAYESEALPELRGASY